MGLRKSLIETWISFQENWDASLQVADKNVILYYCAVTGNEAVWLSSPFHFQTKGCVCTQINDSLWFEFLFIRLFSMMNLIAGELVQMIVQSILYFRLLRESRLTYIYI